jgi:hypothetical protein
MASLFDSGECLSIESDSINVHYLISTSDLLICRYKDDSFVLWSAVDACVKNYFALTIRDIFGPNSNRDLVKLSKLYPFHCGVVDFISLFDLIHLLRINFANFVTNSNIIKYEILIKTLDDKSCRRRNDQDFQNPSYQILHLI